MAFDENEYGRAPAGVRTGAEGNTAPGSGGQAGDGADSGKLQLEASQLKRFKKRVDGILSELETSAAGSSKVSGELVPTSSFGATNFAEATDLSRAYGHVHSQLTKLSQTLGDQIEAMGIAALGIQQGFDTLEDDTKRRFWEIYTRSEGAEDGRGGPEKRDNADDKANDEDVVL